MTRHLRTLGAIALSLCMAAVAQAAQEGGNAAEGPLGNIMKWVHFAILALLAYWVFGRLLPPWFRGNADRISSAISKANEAKAEAERKLREATMKLANLDKEVAEFRAAAEREAVAEIERLKAITKSDGEKVHAAALAEIEAAERAARVELKALAARMAVDGAEQQVSIRMTPAIQEAMINSFVQSLQGRPN